MASITISIPSGANFCTTSTKSLFLVINRVIDSDLAQKFLLRRTRRTVNLQPARPRQLHRRNSNAARRAVNQNAVARLQIAHREHRVISRQIIHGKRRRVFERHSGG